MGAVLVVDDDEEVRVFLRRVLDREGHDIFEASDGYEALNVLERECVGVALVDVVMPHMNGVELMQRMQQEYPETKIVTLSAFGTSWICPTELKVEASLSKPFDLKDLRLVLRRILGQPAKPRPDRAKKRPRRR